MSYDIRICVKVEGLDKYVTIDEPVYSSPTYNLREMFVACMDWDYSTSEENENGEYETVYYPCWFVLEKVSKGISELVTNPDKYKKFEPENGWGSLKGALQALESLHDCIMEQTEEIPIEYLYMAWVY